jgi:hypothetical protein
MVLGTCIRLSSDWRHCHFFHWWPVGMQMSLKDKSLYKYLALVSGLQHHYGGMLRNSQIFHFFTSSVFLLYFATMKNSPASGREKNSAELMGPVLEKVRFCTR